MEHAERVVETVVHGDAIAHGLTRGEDTADILQRDGVDTTHRRHRLAVVGRSDDAGPDGEVGKVVEHPLVV
jgi:hypothetical protein